MLAGVMPVPGATDSHVAPALMLAVTFTGLVPLTLMVWLAGALPQGSLTKLRFCGLADRDRVFATLSVTAIVCVDGVAEGVRTVMVAE
jgi:hypothetical protein